MFSNYNHPKQEKEKGRPILGGVKMRKKYLKIFTLLTACLVASQINTENIFAAPLASIDTTIVSGDEKQCTATGVLTTHDMKVKIGEENYQAYCAWYSKKAPYNSADRLPTAITFEKMDLTDNAAAGLATIINDTSVQSKYGLSGQELIAVRTAAINLFLTQQTGEDRFIGMTYENGILQGYSGNFTTLIVNFKSQYDAFNSNWKTCNTNFNGGTYGLNTEKSQYESCKNQAATYYLYQKGIETSNSVTSAYLRFSDTSSQTLTYSNGYYTGVFKVESNIQLQSNSLDFTITGVTDASQVIATKTPTSKGGTLTIKIPETIIASNVENVNVTVTASTSYKKSVIYKLRNATLRNNYQDLLFAQYEEEPITISTAAKPLPAMKKCYRYVINCDNTTCDNTNSNNTRTCESKVEEYYSTTCETDDKGNKATGKYTQELINGVCSLYCTEKAQVSYPGNVSPAVVLGTNLQWPTASNGAYPLQTTATLTCTVEMDNGGTVTQECLNLASRITYKNGANSAQVKYNDTKTEQTAKLKSDCNESVSLNGNIVTVQNNCSYTLDNVESMINKETLEFVKETSVSLSDAVTNYILINKYGGVLPIAGYNWIDDSIFSEIIFDDSYELEIENMPLGYDNQFTQKVNATAYVCNYKVTTDLSGECACPPGTVYNGMTLLDVMTNSSTPLTCAEAKEIYCDCPDCIEICTKPDGTKVNITECMKTNTREYCEIENGCTSNDGLCPSDSNHPDRSYASCVYGGKTEADCIQEVCYDECVGTACEYKCPANTALAGMDISDCVQERKAQGSNLVSALKSCYKLCNGAGEGTIIYRTISLENPFPSKDADDSVNQTGLTTGMFNDLIKGRYPGTNWNSVTLVYNKILNNRGYDGSAIYQEATPLYTINLDAKAIKEIREYNKKQTEQNKGGYADFELECTDGAYCISSFLHDNIITTATGEPILDYSNSTCGNAYDKSSFISCYTYK